MKGGIVVEEKVKKRVMIANSNQCTGCSICEMVCSMAKHGEYNPSRSYIRILRNWEMDVNVVALDLHCDFCNECVMWCPTRAIRFEEANEAAMIRKQNPLGTYPVPLLTSD
jgi:anaerobic carbon-monoxide dehydrogenase iron sulfur subunit